MFFFDLLTFFNGTHLVSICYRPVPVVGFFDAMAVEGNELITVAAVAAVLLVGVGGIFGRVLARDAAFLWNDITKTIHHFLHKTIPR